MPAAWPPGQASSWSTNEYGGHGPFGSARTPVAGPGQRVRGRHELAGAVTAQQIGGIEKHVLRAPRVARVFGRLPLRGVGDVREHPVDRVRERVRHVRLVHRPVDLHAPFHRVAEAGQQAGELTAAPGQQGTDRVVIGVDGGQPERQDRPAPRRPWR